MLNVDKLTYAASLDYLRDLDQHPMYSFVHSDILDTEGMQKLLREHRIDTIVHFAAESHVDRSIEDPGCFVQNNTVGTSLCSKPHEKCGSKSMAGHAISAAFIMFLRTKSTEAWRPGSAFF